MLGANAVNLIAGGEPVKQAAAGAGFKSESAFRSACKTQFGITPTHHAQMQG